MTALEKTKPDYFALTKDFFVGRIRCPICGNVVCFTYRIFDGKSRGRCETKDCLDWTYNEGV
jgi:hypothetical protein